MATQEKRRDAVNVDEAVHPIYRKLTGADAPPSEKPDADEAPFRTMKDVFMWALCLGARFGKRKKLSKRVKLFDWNVFSQDVDLPCVTAVALAETKDVETLLDQDKVLEIAEEYANAGIHELNARMLENDRQPLTNLVTFLAETLSQPES
jgi:dnd system-associated protein 4